jgi:hypothetical protein
MMQIVFKLEEVSSRPPHCRKGVVAVPSKTAEGRPQNKSTHGIAVKNRKAAEREYARAEGIGLAESEA